ncbi:MAG: hypothetical protein ACJAQX_001505 [Polaribacter sp.]|jgi:hypothetical protein
MKNFYTLLFFLWASVSLLAQTPEKMSYQLVSRDASNTLLTNQQGEVQVSILQATITGSALYTETQTATTNINGLVSLEIGSGNSSDDFSIIDRSAGPFFIKTATDPSGGGSYAIKGTSQLMSVPYALYTKTAGNSTPGPQGEPGIKGDTGAAGTNGTQPTYTVNTFYAELGGYVIEINTDGTHGLVAAMQDQGVSNWYNADDLLSNAINHDVNGAKFKDWRLPTKRELNLMYVQRASIGAFNVNNCYWSSKQVDYYHAWRQYFFNGNQNLNYEYNTNSVRAVRAF